MQPIDSFAFGTLKSEIESFPRQAGHYIIDLVSIADERLSGWSQEQILDAAFEHFDEVKWLPESERPSDQTWADDYVVDYSTATLHVVEALVGGPNIGHLHETISLEQANVFWDRFCDFFQPERKYYVRMGLGNPGYVFHNGAAIVDFDRAGILWVVESD